MTQAYLYIRFSTVAQEGGESLNRQRVGGLALIQERGWTLAETIEDLGRSAWKGAHLELGALGKFSERVRAGDVPAGSWLVAEKTDRLSRQGWETLFDWLREMTRKGLNVATVDGHEFTSASMSDQINVIKILLGGEADRQFSERISERVQDAVRASIREAQAGRRKVIRGRAPGWLSVRLDRSGFDLIPERTEVVRQIYRLAAEGRGSRWIAKHLNERRVPTWGTKQGASAGWDPTTVQWVLKSPAVEGEYVSGSSNPNRVKNAGHVIAGYFPQAVDADLVARARLALKARKWSGGSTAPAAANLFKGLVKCGSCGARMYLNKHPTTGRVFQCSAAMSKRACEQRETFRYEEFERSALDTILDLALDEKFFRIADDAHACTVAVAEAKKRLNEATVRLQRAVDMMLDGEVGDVFAARLPALKNAVEQAKVDLSKSEDALTLARGYVSPAEHQRRVFEVRNAIEATDPVVRLDARLRVTQALAGIVERVDCRVHGEFGRSFWLRLKFDLLRIVIDQDGVVWERVIDRALASSKASATEANLDESDKQLFSAMRRRWSTTPDSAIVNAAIAVAKG